MDRERLRAIQEVCDEWEAGRLDWSFDTVQSLIEPFPLTGHMDFYEEFQDDEVASSTENEHQEPDLRQQWDGTWVGKLSNNTVVNIYYVPIIP